MTPNVIDLNLIANMVKYTFVEHITILEMNLFFTPIMKLINIVVNLV